MTGYLCSAAGKRFFRMNWPTPSKQSLIYACRVGFHLFSPLISLYRRVTLYQFHRFLPVCSFPFFPSDYVELSRSLFPTFSRFSIDHPLPPASLRSSVTSPVPWTSSCVIFNAGRASVRAKWTTVLDAGDRSSKQYSDDLLPQPVALLVLRFYRSFVHSFACAFLPSDQPIRKLKRRDVNSLEANCPLLYRPRNVERFACLLLFDFRYFYILSPPPLPLLLRSSFLSVCFLFFSQLFH